MLVAATFLATLSPDVPRWAFTYDPTEEELAEARRLLGEPHGVLAIAQIQISRGWDGSGYRVSRPMWDTGPLVGATLEEIVRREPQLSTTRRVEP